MVVPVISAAAIVLIGAGVGAWFLFGTDEKSSAPPAVKPEKRAEPEKPKPPPEPEGVTACRENIKAVAALCGRFLRDAGRGLRYPGSYSGLAVDGGFSASDLAVLVRPGDAKPTRRDGLPPSSYEFAFDAAGDRAFGVHTPGDLPMVWERDAPHDGKRFVAYFGGDVRLESADREELFRRVGGTLPAPPEGPAPPAPPAPPGPEPPPAPAPPGPERPPKPPEPEVPDDLLMLKILKDAMQRNVP